MKDVANQEAGQSSRPTVFRVSSQDVPEPHGLEYCATFLGSALVPMSLVCADADVFRSELNVAPLASISIVRSFGTRNCRHWDGVVQPTPIIMQRRRINITISPLI